MAGALPEIAGWLPPSESNWTALMGIWAFFPLVTAIQWLTPFYPQGKTSIRSRLNLPGRLAWAVMETPGHVLVLLCWLHRPGPAVAASGSDDPVLWPRRLLVGLFVGHYLYRAYLGPLLLNPSMSPIHPVICAAAATFQVANGVAIGGWIAGVGSAGSADVVRPWLIGAGVAVWLAGWAGNVFHEEVLRDIRRTGRPGHQDEPEPEKDKKDEKKPTRPGPAQDKAGRPAATTTTATPREDRAAAAATKLYRPPPRVGLFRYMLYPHYLCEWAEWAGFWLIGASLSPTFPFAGGPADPAAAAVLLSAEDSLFARTARAALASVFSATGRVPPDAAAVAAVETLERAAGWLPAFLPAAMFVLFELATMVPRARQGLGWYRDRFGDAVLDQVLAEPDAGKGEGSAGDGSGTGASGLGVVRRRGAISPWF